MDRFMEPEFRKPRILGCLTQVIDNKRKAERAGFEPAVRFDPHTAFPVPHLRPLGHLSVSQYLACSERFMSPTFVWPCQNNGCQKISQKLSAFSGSENEAFRQLPSGNCTW